MTYTYVSSAANASILTASLMRMRRDLGAVTAEISTGRYADVGETLGARLGQSITLRQSQTQLAALADANATVTTRLDATQTALNALRTTAEKFQTALVSAPDGQSGRATLKTLAQDALRALTATLNQTLNGEALFGGQATNAAPASDYFASPPGAAKAANDAAFLAAFGVSQSSPAITSITGAQMQNFLGGAFSARFDPAAWKANWSAASDNPLRARISPDETIDASVSANAPALRKLAMVYTMVSDLAIEGLGDDAFQHLKTAAAKSLGEAMSGLVELQASAGAAQSRVTQSTETMKAASATLATTLSSLESADPTEASARLNELQTRIEASYALTARLQQLSLFKYL